jgi:S1-C subfamily serine protease
VKTFLSIVFFLFLSVNLRAQITTVDKNYIEKTAFPATTLLYAQADDGSLSMRCTATFIEKNSTGYVAVSAAHCACADNEDDHTVSPEKTFFYVTSDEAENKEFIRAKLVGCGYRHAGDDFSIFQVNTTHDFPVVPLGIDPSVMEPVINIASPLGLGKQVFTGSVSAASLNRPIIQDDINWTHAVLLQLFGTDGGSSGSAVICSDQRAICGLIVGTYNKTSTIALPISRLVRLREQLAKGEYKHWQPNADEVSTKQVSKKDNNN